MNGDRSTMPETAKDGRCNIALRPGVRVTLEGSPEIGVVTDVRGFEVKVLWRGFISRWLDAERVKPTGFSRKGEKPLWDSTLKK